MLQEPVKKRDGTKLKLLDIAADSDSWDRGKMGDSGREFVEFRVRLLGMWDAGREDLECHWDDSRRKAGKVRDRPNADGARINATEICGGIWYVKRWWVGSCTLLD